MEVANPGAYVAPVLAALVLVLDRLDPFSPSKRFAFSCSHCVSRETPIPQVVCYLRPADAFGVLFGGWAVLFVQDCPWPNDHSCLMPSGAASLDITCLSPMVLLREPELPGPARTARPNAMPNGRTVSHTGKNSLV